MRASPGWFTSLSETFSFGLLARYRDFAGLVRGPL